VPGRELAGIHFAMACLTQQNRLREGDTVADADRITAKDKHVIIGGGDTGADCLGTAHRQGARSVHQLELLERPPVEMRPLANSEFTLNADLVLLAMGFLGPERGGLLDQLGVTLTDRGTVQRDANWMTKVPGVFTAGDMQRGQLCGRSPHGRSVCYGPRA